MTTKRHRAQGEEGVTLVLVTLLMVALMLIVSIVIDLGSVRQDRQASRSAVDAAASTAALELSSGSAQSACQAAWSATARSLGVSPAPPSPCSIFSTGACNPAATRTATGSMGQAVVSISTPVASGDPLMSAETPGGNIAQVADASFDGDPCTRVGVRIVRTRTPFFAQVGGINSWTTDVHAVAKFSSTNRPGGEVPALVALDPTGCAVVDAKSGSIIVSPPLSSAGPGVIRTDTTNNSCSSNFVMDVQNTANGLIRVDGAGGPGLGNLVNLATSNVYRPGAASGPTTGYYGNRVTAAAAVTRNPFDLIYRCSTSVVAPGSPRCPGGQVDVYNTAIAPLLTGVPAGYQVLGPATVPWSCGTVPAVMPSGNWYVDCDSFNRTTAFLGAGTVVFRGGVDVAQLTFNCLSTVTCGTDKLVVIRGLGPSPNLNLQSTGATLTAPRTTIYQERGNIYMRGGPVVTWTAPTGTTTPTKSIMYWNESVSTLDLGGNPVINQFGIAFVPRSTVAISGNGTIDARRVQFWANRVAITSGAATFLLQPDPTAAITTSGAVSTLVR